MKSLLSLALGAATLVATLTTIAEEVRIHRTVDVRSEHRGSTLSGGEKVRNAPVQARLVTRTVQELCDGNRIVNERSELLYRDSEGRVRREIEGGEGVEMVFIEDGSGSAMLDPGLGLGVPLPPMAPIALGSGAERVMVFAGSAPDVEVEVVSNDVAAPEPADAPAAKSVREVRIQKHVVGNGPAAPLPPMADMGWIELLGGGGDTSVEPLGQDKINGIRVEGNRYTTTYPEGAFGNEKPIEVVKTTWYAPELRMMIRSEEFDPRSGTVTYEAEVLSRKEPAAELFEVPERS